MKHETRQTLMRIVEKANILKSFNFDEHVKLVGSGFKGTRNDDAEKFDSFILALRSFYQADDPISFPSLARYIYDPELSPEWSHGASKARRAFFDTIADYSKYWVDLLEGHPSRHRILDTVLYGMAANADPDKINQLRQWTGNVRQANLLQQEFTGMLVQFLGLITYIGELSERELALNPA